MMIPHIPVERIQSERRELQKAVQERVTGYILTALGLVAGLAWNDAIRSAIEAFFPADGSGIAAKFVYAALITLFVAVAAYYITKVFTKKEDPSAK